MAVDASNVIKTAVVRRLRADFNRHAVNLGTNPLFIQDRPIPGIATPYVYVDIAGTREVDKTKTDSAKDYTVRLKVVTRTNQEQSGEVLRDGIATELVRVLDAPGLDYLDLSDNGFSVYMQNAYVVSRYIDPTNQGATYFIAIVDLVIRAYHLGVVHSDQPSFAQSFTYSGFGFTPSNERIEEWDHGSITVGDSYPNSNGYQYVSSVVAQAAGETDGTLTGRVLSISDSDENIGLSTTATFELITNTDTTVEITDTDSFPRIKSLRYGTITSASDPVFTDDQAVGTGLRNLEQWNTGNRTLDHGNVNPVGDTITIDGDAGDYLYIVYDASQAALTSVVEQVGNQNVLTQVFNDPVVVGGYRIYISTNPMNYDGTQYTYELG